MLPQSFEMLLRIGRHLSLLDDHSQSTRPRLAPLSACIVARQLVIDDNESIKFTIDVCGVFSVSAYIKMVQLA